jgi:hypothetical protein
MSSTMHSEMLCENCRIVIRWQPTVVDGKTYCCLGCAQGGPCNCDYDNLPRSDDTGAIVLRAVRKPEAPEGN